MGDITLIMRNNANHGTNIGNTNNLEKLLIISEKTSKYRIKDGKICCKINGIWKELKNYYKEKGY